MNKPPKMLSHWQQASQIAFLVLYLIVILTAISWATSNIKKIAPDSRAVVFRMGEMVHIQNSGLLFAWPQPFEQVVIIPSIEQTIKWRSQALLRTERAKKADMINSTLNDALAGSGYLLTGDSGIVQLDLSVFYNVTEPYDFVLQSDHVIPALDRLVQQSAMAVCAERDIDEILVARPELMNSNTIVTSREQLRLDIQNKINNNLIDLKQKQAGLGISIVRVDVQSSLPNKAMSAFNSVLTASQQAAKEIASAQNDAAQTLQQATQSVEYILQVAQAKASERLAKARTDTAVIITLINNNKYAMNTNSLLNIYHEKIASVLRSAKTVDMVNENDAGHLIIEGAK